MVLTIPVENLLMLVPNQIHLPFAGLTGMGQLPLVADTKKGKYQPEGASFLYLVTSTGPPPLHGGDAL